MGWYSRPRDLMVMSNGEQIIGCLFSSRRDVNRWPRVQSSRFLRGGGWKQKMLVSSAASAGPRAGRGQRLYNGGIVCARWQEKLRPPCFCAFFISPFLSAFFRFLGKLLWRRQKGIKPVSKAPPPEDFVRRSYFRRVDEISCLIVI